MLLLLLSIIYVLLGVICCFIFALERCLTILAMILLWPLYVILCGSFILLMMINGKSF